MAYIDKDYYSNVFKGTEIEDGLFARLADIASEVIYGVCVVKPEEEDLIDETFKKAVAYQVEMLYLQGGMDAVTGFSEASMAGGSEHLGDYSISVGSGSAGKESVKTYHGIPVSSISLLLLKRLGLMRRWVYARWCDT